ncbi:MAG: tRNA (adenosine(37)-N6)-dimethylallyltransferase MiaA [Erysipelotrichaceae bacterium]|nr:tRNA (adenosine(37)-N6)-dimethylallyltransferase MiaA [Erysipelotrichaceae bacterium]
MQKVLTIVGPTAIGKTSFGIECAKAFNGEIISGDSIQIYKGLDIGSGKATKEELNECKHHLIDIKNPDENYSVKQFQDKARQLIEDISCRGKLPIIVGGTGLYIKACLFDFEFFEEEEEDNQYEEFTNQELYNMLMEKDPRALDKIHVNNRKRLVRALNIYEKHKIGISEIKDSQEHKCLYDSLIIGLTCSRENLYKKIDSRVDQMMEDGLINEIKNLLDTGIDFSNQSMTGIGYKEFKAYFDKEKTLEECVNDVKTNSHHFAKRQYTYFKNQLNVEWFEDKSKAYKRVEQWI